MNILFVRYKKSQKIFEGGEQVSQKNFNLLSKIVGSDNITTYYVHDENVKKRFIDYLKGAYYFTKNYFFGLTPRRVAQIVNMAREYDVVFIDRSVFGIISKFLKENGYNGKVICFFHNVEVPYFDAKIGNHKPGKKIILNCVDNNDAFCCKYADKTIALNSRDDAEIYRRYHRHVDELIPVALKDSYQRSSYSQEFTRKQPLCLFLGAYFPPNNEGIEWFMQHVYPHVNISVKIVGKGMNKLREHYNIPDNIEVISDVPDLKPYFEEADLMILPIFKGSGMKVKTCESLMYGKNILATDEAFMGYDIDYDMVGGKCNTGEEFIAKIKEFESNPRPRFNTYSRQIFLEKYTEEAVENKFRKILIDY